MRNCAICKEQLPIHAEGVLCPACSASNRPPMGKRQIRTPKPEQSRTTFITPRYGLAVEQQRILYGQQHGRCGICGRDIFLVLDHDHATRKVRGYLCRGCNTKLSGFDDIAFTSKARAYLDNPPVNKL